MNLCDVYIALVLTKGAIIPNPYPHCCVALKGRKEDE